MQAASRTRLRRLRQAEAVAPWSVRLPLPVADAAEAGIARPFLNARVQGLRVERIAMPRCRRGSCRPAELRDADMCNSDLPMRHHGRFGARLGRSHSLYFMDPWRALGGNLGGICGRPGLHLRGIASAIGAGLGRARDKFGARAKRYRREQRLGHIEIEKFGRTVLICHQGAADGQQRGAEKRWQDAFQDHFRRLGTMAGTLNTSGYLGRRWQFSSRACGQGYHSPSPQHAIVRKNRRRAP